MITGLKKIREFRPAPCTTRIGDLVEMDGTLYLQVKCRKCSKQQSKDVFHYIPVSDAIHRI